MSVVVLQAQSFRRMVRVLREFDGARSLWRVPVAAVLYIAPAIVLLGSAVLASYVASGGWTAQTAVLSAVITLLSARVAQPRLSRWQLHRRIIAKRLRTWEEPNIATETPVLVRSRDFDAATSALRLAGFNPGSVAITLGSPPADAPELDTKLPVHEPSAWPQSASDDDRIQRIAHILRQGGIRARVASVDVP